MRMKKRFVCFLCMITLLFGLSSNVANAATKTTKNYITIGEYVKLLDKALNLKPANSSMDGYIEVATKNGILVKKNEFSNYNKKLTRAQCALLTERANEILNGVDYDILQCKQAKKLKRISDLKKIDKKYQDAVVKIYLNGIMVGSSDGKFTHSRTFNGNGKVTVKGAKTVITRMKNKKKRLPMTEDGQLIRTTNLPVNAKEYEYILASFPNSYYDTKFSYEYGTCTNNVIKEKLVFSPANVKNDVFRSLGYVGTVEETRYMINTYSQEWADKIAKHIKLLFNVDYRNIDNTWAKKLAKTYYASDDEATQRIYNHIKAYIKEMKKNHVVCKTSKISLDKSSLYYDGGYKMRVYVKYRMKADDMSNTATILYDRSGIATFTETKKWVWKECYFDISIGAKDGSHGDDFEVDNMFLTDCLNERKTKILKPVYDKETGLYSFK